MAEWSQAKDRVILASVNIISVGSRAVNEQSEYINNFHGHHSIL